MILEHRLKFESLHPSKFAVFSSCSLNYYAFYILAGQVIKVVGWGWILYVMDNKYSNKLDVPTKWSAVSSAAYSFMAHVYCRV